MPHQQIPGPGRESTATQRAHGWIHRLIEAELNGNGDATLDEPAVRRQVERLSLRHFLLSRGTR